MLFEKVISQGNISTKVDGLTIDHLRELCEKTGKNISDVLTESIYLYGKENNVESAQLIDDNEFKEDFTNKLNDYIKSINEHSTKNSFYLYIISLRNLHENNEDLESTIYLLIERIYNELKLSQLRKLVKELLRTSDSTLKLLHILKNSIKEYEEDAVNYIVTGHINFIQKFQQ